jgi:hypothetical protein
MIVDHTDHKLNVPDLAWLSGKRARKKQILRFRESQQRRRQWISIAEIADWIACSRGATDRRDETLRAQGYDDLLNAMLLGEFDHNGRSGILYLSPDPERSRLEVGKLRNMRDFYANSSTLNDEVLARCWVPRKLAQRWFQRRDLPWPKQFDPVQPSPPSRQVAGQTRRSAYQSRVEEIRKLYGRDPPLENTKSGIQGDREWAAANGISRPDIEMWRRELLWPQRRGRPRNSAANSAEQ